MAAVVYILFGAGLTVVAATAAGRLLLSRAKLPFDRGEHLLFSFLTGSAVLSLLVFLLCTLGLARKGVFLAAGLCLLATWRRSAAPSGAPIPRPWKILLFTVGGAYAGLYFFNALKPEISPDGSTYHLGLVARYLREHGFHRITNDLHASFSEGIEMLFLFAFAFGRHSAAAIVHFALLLALPAMVILYARRAGMTAAGVCAALFVFLSPVFGVDGTSAYNDVATASLAFGVFYLLQIWDAERKPALAVPIGLLAGFAYAAKFTAAVSIPYALGFVVWRSWRSRQPFLKPLLVIAACALLMAVPWMAKNWLWVDNPFSPFFNQWFPNPYIQLGFEKELDYHMHHYEGIVGNAELPWVIAVDGRLSGFLGPLFLLSPLGLAALRWREGRQLLLAALVFAGPYLMNFGTRFLMPAAVFVALAMAMVLVRWKAVAVAIVLLHAVASWPTVTPLYCNGGSWRLHEIPVRAALRLEPEDHYLSVHLINYNLARLIERTVPPGGKVLSFSQIAEAYTAREILVVYQSAANKLLGEILWTPLVAQYMPNRVLQFDLPREPLRAIRVVQTTASATEQWSITELRVVPAAPIRQTGAQPNPWELPLAFDGKAVTRWRTWLPLEPGQFVQADFAQAQPIERIELQCTRDQPAMRLRLEGEDASGRWKMLSAVASEREIEPIPDLRRMAAAELKARGVDYVMVFGSDLGADDFRLRAGEWGIRQVGELGNDRLYKID
jgi:4-amino-4-deoxy-L-arabinose transferase-like glycosyltransferase